MKKTLLRALASLLCLALCFSAALAEPAALPDGEYVPDGFTFTGGTGKVKITCPKVTISGGEATATLVFSSPNYPKLTSDGVEYTGGLYDSGRYPLLLGRIPAR